MSFSLLISGGTGFVGRSLLHYLVSLSSSDLNMPRVVALSRDPEDFLKRFPCFAGHEWLSFHTGNILHPGSLPTSRPFTRIIHAAADSTLGPKLSSLDRFVQNVEGTRNLLEFAVRSSTKRFLFLSSGAVYGRLPPHLDSFSEDWGGSLSLTDPQNSYALGKRAAEHLCALYHEIYGIEYVIARCFAFVGPDLPLGVHFAVGNFIRDAISADGITVASDGSPLRSYLEQNDMAEWLWHLLSEGHAGEAYNVGSNEVISIAKLAHLVRDLIAPHKPVHILKNPDLSLDRNRYIPNIEKAKRLHGLKVTVPLAEAILRTAHAHQLP